MGLTIDQDIEGNGSEWTVAPIGETFSRIGACGKSFGRGIFKFHDALSGHAGTAAVHQAFPRLAGGSVAFAVDWLGVQYVVVSDAFTSSGFAEVFAADPFDMSLVPIVRLDEFLGFLSSPLMLEQVQFGLFEQWLAASGGTAVGWDRCAGAIQPAFLDGSRSIDNLEDSDVAVYWEVMTIAAERSAHLQPGERLDSL